MEGSASRAFRARRWCWKRGGSVIEWRLLRPAWAPQILASAWSRRASASTLSSSRVSRQHRQAHAGRRHRADRCLEHHSKGADQQRAESHQRQSARRHHPPELGRDRLGCDGQNSRRSSFALSNQPLIYVDGIRVDNAQGTGPQNQSFGASTTTRWNDFNPDDIESIEIVKGPAAATLYGTEAANGVIQIITKQGGQGKPTWD